MIELTRFDGSHFYVNAEFIEFIETTPDTVLSLIDHKKLLVRESMEEVVERIVDYHTQINARGTHRSHTVSYLNTLPHHELSELDDAGHADSPREDALP